MKFNELQKIMEENYGAERPADIAKELDVSPQTVNNWKTRDFIPYKYTRKIRLGLKGNNIENISTPVPALNSNDSYNFKPYFLFFRKNFKLLAGIVLTFIIIALYYLLLIVEPVYISEAKILPSNSSNNNSLSGASGIAAQFGMLNLKQRSSDLSSAELFPDIVNSRTLAKQVLMKKFKYPSKNSRNVELYKILLRIDSAQAFDSTNALNAALKIFQTNVISIRKINRFSPLFLLSVKTNNALLSKNIASFILIELDKIQNNFKLKSIIEKKRFIEQRLVQVQNELIDAENELKVYVDKNRNILSSPALMLERERLLREVEMRNQVYITLKTEYELIKVEEIGKTLKVSILDAPEVPTEKAGPSKKSALLSFILISVMIDILLVVLGVNFKEKLNKSLICKKIFNF